MPDLAKEFSDALKTECRKLNWSRSYLQTISGIDNNALSSYFLGKSLPSYIKLRQLIEAFNTSPNNSLLIVAMNLLMLDGQYELFYEQRPEDRKFIYPTDKYTRDKPFDVKYNSIVVKVPSK